MTNLLSLFGRPRTGWTTAAALLLLGLVCIAIGFPESTIGQSRLLQLGSLLVSLSLGAVLLVLIGQRPHLWERKGFLWTMYVASGLILLGVLVDVAALFVAGIPLGPLGQFLILIGFGTVAVYLIMRGMDLAKENAVGSRVMDLLDGQNSVPDRYAERDDR